jgi:RNase P/RNase MRP subunit POP5
LALEVESDEAFEAKELTDAVWSAIIKLYGEYGASQAGLSMIRYDAERRLSIVRVANAACDNVRTALATVTMIAGKPASIHVTAVSGTIKALNRRVSEHSR